MFIVNVSILDSENSGWNKISPTESNDLDVEFTYDGQKTKQCLCMYIYLFQRLFTRINKYINVVDCLSFIHHFQ